MTKQTARKPEGGGGGRKEWHFTALGLFLSFKVHVQPYMYPPSLALGAQDLAGFME
jgi:hypothetical protein